MWNSADTCSHDLKMGDIDRLHHFGGVGEDNARIAELATCHRPTP